MKIVIYCALLIFASAAVGCMAGVTDRHGSPSHDAKYQIVWEDNLEKSHFDVSLISQDDRPICVDVRTWPTLHGELVGADSAATVAVGDKKFPSFVDLPLECKGEKCFIAVKPRARLDGFVNYSEFPGLIDLAREPKKFEFTPSVWTGGGCTP